MRANKSRDTAPERALRQALRARGLLGYRVDHAPLPNVRRRADVVFIRKRVSIFLDGCFWHGCAEHYVASKTNVEYWRSKIEKNQKRDAETDRLLNRAGWIVVRVWEHENPLTAAERIEIIMRSQTSVASQ